MSNRNEAARKFFNRARRGRGARVLCLTLAALSVAFAGVACRRDMQDQPRYEAFERSEFFKDGVSMRPLIEGTVARGNLRENTALYTGKKGAGAASVQAGSTATSTATDEGAAAATSATASANTASGGTARGGTAAVGDTTGGATSAGEDVTEFPFPITQAVLTRGQERYQIFCSMCHGATGHGDGMVVRRGYRQPPSYHTDALRESPVGHFYDVITNGWGTMPNYAAQITPQDRWAIVAYVRALQLSQQGNISELSPEERDKLLKKTNESGGGHSR